MKLNAEEWTIGAIFGLLFFPWIGFWAILTSQLCALFWALTGAGFSKLFRRFGCPFIVCLAVYLVKHSWQIWISLPLAFAVLSIGYGTPSTQPLDEGSWLGRFWFARSKHYNFLTRATIYLLLALSFLPILFLQY